MKTINRLAGPLSRPTTVMLPGYERHRGILGLCLASATPTPLSFLAPTGIFQTASGNLWPGSLCRRRRSSPSSMHWNDYRENAAVCFRPLPLRRAHLAATPPLPSRRFFLSTAASCRLSTWCR